MFVFTHPDKCDFYMIRSFKKTRKGTSDCPLGKCICGEDNDARHGHDECQILMDDKSRLQYKNSAFNLLGQAQAIQTRKENLLDLCSIAYFRIIPVEN